MTMSVPGFPVLQAPPAWRVVDFISDLHLQAGDSATFAVWRHYMAGTPADAVFILGDLFEVWVGDDVADTAGFEQDCRRILASTAGRCDVFFMSGNRDFLVGDAFLGACQTRRLDDPTALDFLGQRCLLSHGDALCLDDTDYQHFRAEVRSPAWQQAFLARPLAERQAIARDLRRQSEMRKRASQPSDYVDVDALMACTWLDTAQATTLIHGHTHRPGDHDLGDNAGPSAIRSTAMPRLQRRVLSDWDAAATPARAQVLRLSARGLQRIDIA